MRLCTPPGASAGRWHFTIPGHAAVCRRHRRVLEPGLVFFCCRRLRGCLLVTLRCPTARAAGAALTCRGRHDHTCRRSRFTRRGLAGSTVAVTSPGPAAHCERLLGAFERDDLDPVAESAAASTAMWTPTPARRPVGFARSTATPARTPAPPNAGEGRGRGASARSFATRCHPRRGLRTNGAASSRRVRHLGRTSVRRCRSRTGEDADGTPSLVASDPALERAVRDRSRRAAPWHCQRR